MSPRKAMNLAGTDALSCQAAPGYVFTAPDGQAPARLDRFLAACLEGEGLSREKIKSAILAGNAFVNDSPALAPKTPVLAGDVVRLCLERPSSTLLAEQGEVNVLYQDAVLAVINKAAGVTVHPAPGLENGTLVHRLLAHFPQLAAQEGFRPGIVHRLDKDTSGLMLVALTEECRLALARQFAERQVFKEYLALCHGVPQKPVQTIKAPLGRDAANKTRMAVMAGGREAHSEARLLYSGPLQRFSLMAVRIFTGRTHQVRVHMRHVGHPLWGDAVYTGACTEQKKKIRKPAAPRACSLAPCPALSQQAAAPSSPDCALPQRQMLHAWKLRFRHPFPHLANLPSGPLSGPLSGQIPGQTPGQAPGQTPDTSGQHLLEQYAASPFFSQNGAELSFLCPPPIDFIAAARCLSQRCLRVVITGLPGCGKSALVEILRSKALPVFNADACVAALYAPGGDGRRLLRQRFGDRFVPDNEQAPVNKSALGAAMSEDDALRREIESLIHPLVQHATTQFWLACEEKGASLAFAEIPLYLESGQRAKDAAHPESAPLLLGVNCPFAIRSQRLEHKRGWSKNTIARMESWQWPEKEKMRACDMLLDNNASMEALRKRSNATLHELEKLRATRLDTVMRDMAALWNNQNA